MQVRDAREAAVSAFTTARPRLEALAARITNDRDEAADIASEAFVALIERGPANADEMTPWLYTVTRNRALNRVRDRGRAARRALPVFDEPPPPTTANGPLRALLERAQSRLAARDRLALRLRYNADASYGEIAVALGVSESNARLVVHRAARRFRRETVSLLADHHEAASDCRESLAQSAMRQRVPVHPGCNACTSVIDEVQALASNAVVPVAASGIVSRVVDRLTARLAPRVYGLNEHVNRFGEGAAALVVAGTIALGIPVVAPGSAASVPLDREPTPSATEQAILPVEDGAVSPVSPAAAASVEIATNSVSGDIGVAPEVIVPVNGPNVSEDAAADGSPLTSSFSEPMDQAAPGWMPRAVTDAFASDRGQGADVRRFEVASFAGDDGEPVGLRFTIDVDGPPGDDIGYEISWAYAGTDCTSDRISVDYASSSKPRTAEWTHSCSTDRGYETAEAKLPLTIEGARVTVDLPFALVPEDTFVAPAPGVHLIDVYVVVMDYQRPLALLDADRAPDSGGIEYRAEREPDRRQASGTT